MLINVTTGVGKSTAIRERFAEEHRRAEEGESLPFPIGAIAAPTHTLVEETRALVLDVREARRHGGEPEVGAREARGRAD